jgi:hypothetical protein
MSPVGQRVIGAGTGAVLTGIGAYNNGASVSEAAGITLFEFFMNGGTYGGFRNSPSAGSTGNAKEVFIDSSKYPQSLQHLEDAGGLNRPLTVNRAGAAQNRADALRGLPKVPGMDLDEVPPAFLRKPGDPVSVRPLPPDDNRGSGASMGNQARDVPDGGQVILRERPGE